MAFYKTTLVGSLKTRREFIKTMGILASGAMVLKAFPGCLPKKSLVGLQLWTLRDTIQSETRKTLELVSRIGYNNIEPYGFDGSFYGIPAGEFRKMVLDMGMKLTSTHTGITLDNADLFLTSALEAGLEFLVLPSPGGRPAETADDYKKIAEELNRIGEKCRNAGIRFGYHNHAGEFKPDGDLVPYDILISGTDPDLVCFEMDNYWVVKGGGDPVAYIKKYPGRFALWHIKDMAETGESTTIGGGTLDFKDLFSYKEDAGMVYFYVEQESYVSTPLESIEESHKYIVDHLI